LGYGIHYTPFSFSDNGKRLAWEKSLTALTFRTLEGMLIGLIFETLMGVFRIRLQCGKSGRAPRMTLGLVKNASNHYMANPM